MSAEHQKPPPKSIVQRIGDSALAGFVLRDVIMPRMETQIFDAIHPEYTEGFDQAYQELIKQGYVPIILMNHQSHADGIPASLVTDRLTKLARKADPEHPLQGFQLIVASSMVKGNQGGFLQAITKYLEPNFAKKNQHLIPYTRQSDVEKYGVPTNHIEVAIQLTTSMKEHYGFGFFPEAHLTGGRHKKDGSGEINGMQPFDTTEFKLPAILKIARRQGKKVMFIPVGIHGGYRILSPNTKLPNMDAFLGLFQNPPPILVQVRVGMPITQEALQQLTDETGESPNILLAKAIAKLLPEQAQGVYRETPETPKLPRSGTIYSRVVNLFRRGS